MTLLVFIGQITGGVLLDIFLEGSFAPIQILAGMIIVIGFTLNAYMTKPLLPHRKAVIQDNIQIQTMNIAIIIINKQKPLIYNGFCFEPSSYGGGCGIRTHVSVKTN
jgi:hypothetical protein